MGGGDLLQRNLIFNMVRETQDHGAFNSWDRQPFYVTRDGKDTYLPLVREIRQNLWFNDYNSQEAVDNDDNSCYYSTHHNVFPLSSGGMKSDFGGHDNVHQHNFYYSSNNCMVPRAHSNRTGHTDAFFENTCVINAVSPQYAVFWGDTTSAPVMHDNAVYTQDGKAGESGRSIAEWQAEGHDLGTTVGKIPGDEVLISVAKGILHMH
jgi:hypothetical protein